MLGDSSVVGGTPGGVALAVEVAGAGGMLMLTVAVGAVLAAAVGAVVLAVGVGGACGV